jgi:hypothetical protein
MDLCDSKLSTWIYSQPITIGNQLPTTMTTTIYLQCSDTRCLPVDTDVIPYMEYISTVISMDHSTHTIPLPFSSIIIGDILRIVDYVRTSQLVITAPLSRYWLRDQSTSVQTFIQELYDDVERMRTLLLASKYVLCDTVIEFVFACCAYSHNTLWMYQYIEDI